MGGIYWHLTSKENETKINLICQNMPKYNPQPVYMCKLKKTIFFLNFASTYLLFLLFSAICVKVLKEHILTSVWSAQHPNAGPNIQHAIQWGSEIWPFEIQLFEGLISNGRALAMAIAIVPTIKKTAHLKSRHFCPYFKLFLTKWRPFVLILIGRASRFLIPFEIRTICNPAFFRPFKIQTSLDFRSPTVIKLFTGNLKSAL